MKVSPKDRIYANKLENVDNFVFDGKVADVFEDMIERSVPGYGELNKIIPIISNRYIKSNTNCYDLGCSLAESSLSIAKNLTQNEVIIFAIDNSHAMIRKVDNKIVSLNISNIVKSKCADVFDVEINNATFVILNYTLQFIDPNRREELLAKIYSGMNKGGALFISEKITHKSNIEETIMRDLHEDYKRANAYSDIEISQKREALENVLIRDPSNVHINRLNNAGFSNVFILFKYLNFVSYLAVK